jgi:hypothetical protein
MNVGLTILFWPSVRLKTCDIERIWLNHVMKLDVNDCINKPVILKHIPRKLKSGNGF